MPLQYVIDMHCYQSISLVQDMVIVDVMKPQNNYIMYLTDIIITIIIVNSCISNTTYITVNYVHTTCNPLIVRSLDFVQTSAHVQKITQLSKLICAFQYILKQNTYS